MFKKKRSAMKREKIKPELQHWDPLKPLQN